MPTAFTVSNSPLTSNGTIAVTGAGSTSQYVRGDGSLATFPTVASEAQRLITEVYNETGATLIKGTVVYINGGHGNLPTITKAIATGDATSAQTYGIVQNDITDNRNGFVVVSGSLTDINTNSYAPGTALYLSSTIAGAWTSTKQYAPAHLVYLGVVTRQHPTQGIVEVKIQNGYELDELHNVAAQSPSNGDILQYVSATSLWTKTAGTTSNITEGSNLYYTDARARSAFSESVTGLDYNSTTGVLSTTSGYGIPTTASQTTWDTAYNDSIVSAAVTGTATKTLTLNQQDGGTITASWNDYDTAPVTSVFGRTGAVVAASGDYTTTQVTEGTNLYYTDARFNTSFAAKSTTFLTEGTNLYYTDARARAAISLTTSGTSGAATYTSGVLNIPQYQAALTNPVTGTGTTNYITKWTSGSVVGNSIIYDNGTNVGIGTTSSPLSKLHISGSGGITWGAIANSYGFTTIGDTTATGASLFVHTPSVNDDFQSGFGVDGSYASQKSIINLKAFGVKSAGGYSSEIAFHTSLEDTLSERVRITSAGLGIGTSNPTYKLDVTGTGHFTGSVTFDTVPSSLQDATTANHLVRYSQFIASTSIKYLSNPVITVSLSNITLSGTQSVSGVSLIAGDRVLVAGQTTASQNGVYVVEAGAWTRATDSDTDAELRGYIINIAGSGTYAGYKYINTNATAITVGTTAITYAEFSNLIETDPIFSAWRDQSRTANTFWAAPNGSNGAATWRAILAADIPILNQNTTGSASVLATARTIAASGDAVWSVSFDGFISVKLPSVSSATS